MILRSKAINEKLLVYFDSPSLSVSLSPSLPSPSSWQVVSLWWAPCCVWHELLLWQSVFRGGGSVHQLLRLFCQEVRSKPSRAEPWPEPVHHHNTADVCLDCLCFIVCAFNTTTQLPERHFGCVEIIYFIFCCQVHLNAHLYFYKNVNIVEDIYSFWIVIKKENEILPNLQVLNFLIILMYLWFQETTPRVNFVTFI